MTALDELVTARSIGIPHQAQTFKLVHTVDEAGLLIPARV